MASTTGRALQPKVGAALLGCGYWGANLCRVLSAHNAIQLRWVCDHRESARDQAGKLASSAGTTGGIGSIPFTRRLNLGTVRQDVDALWNLAPHDVRC